MCSVFLQFACSERVLLLGVHTFVCMVYMQTLCKSVSDTSDSSYVEC